MSTTGTDLPAGLIDVWAFLDSTKRLIKLHNSPVLYWG